MDFDARAPLAGAAPDQERADTGLGTAVFESDSPARTRGLARELGRRCRGGECLLLDGDLGAGKTCFVQGLAAGLEVDGGERAVTSPTFVLHAVHPGRLELHHLDLYRLAEAPGGALDLGFDLLPGTPGTVTAVEWARYLPPPRPGACLRLRLELAGEQSRRLELTAHGEAHAALLAGLLASVAGLRPVSARGDDKENQTCACS